MPDIYGTPAPDAALTEAQQRAVNLLDFITPHIPPLPPASAGPAMLFVSDFDVQELGLIDVGGVGRVFMGVRMVEVGQRWLDTHDSSAAAMTRCMDLSTGEIPMVVMTQGATLIAGLSGGDRRHPDPN